MAGRCRLVVKHNARDMRSYKCTRLCPGESLISPISLFKINKKRLVRCTHNTVDTILSRNVLDKSIVSNKWYTDLAKEWNLWSLTTSFQVIVFRLILKNVMYEHLRFWDNNVSFERVQSWRRNGRGETGRSVNSSEQILLDRMHLVQLQLLQSLCLRHMQYTAGIIDLPPFCPTNATSSSSPKILRRTSTAFILSVSSRLGSF